MIETFGKLPPKSILLPKGQKEKILAITACRKCLFLGFLFQDCPGFNATIHLFLGSTSNVNFVISRIWGLCSEKILGLFGHFKVCFYLPTAFKWDRPREADFQELLVFVGFVWTFPQQRKFSQWFSLKSHTQSSLNLSGEAQERHSQQLIFLQANFSTLGMLLPWARVRWAPAEVLGLRWDLELPAKPAAQ